MTQRAYELIGSPETVGVSVDPDALVVAVRPETDPLYAYSLYGAPSKPAISVAVARKSNGIMMPDGHYPQVSPGIYVHQSRLNMAPEAQLIRLFKGVGWEERGLNQSVRRIALLMQVAWPLVRRCSSCRMPVKRKDYIRAPRTPRAATRGRPLGSVSSTWAAAVCPACSHNNWPQDDTVFPRSRDGMKTWMYALWYLAQDPSRNYRDLEPFMSHAVAVRAATAFRAFDTPPIKNLKLERLSTEFRSTNWTYLRVFHNNFRLTKNAWIALGRPARVNVSVDPVKQIITVVPDPDGAHALSFRNSEHQGAVQATVANISESVVPGVYDPITIGRFEGVFQFRPNQPKPRRKSEVRTIDRGKEAGDFPQA
jgi:hypothetical protein